MRITEDEPATIQTLLEIMDRLRAPDGGCPWDRQQDFRSIAPYTLEEACEVVDAIERDDKAGLQDELGDLLFQVVYHAQMASESGWFDFDDVLQGVCNKMVRRHPHVFAGEVVADASAQTRAWEAHKQKERGGATAASVLDGVPLALPALMRADKLQRKASRVGFDWPDIRGVFDKVEEELEELRAEIEGLDNEAIRDEAGDLLFAVVNLLRHAGVEPESALRQANSKFTRRFQQVERLCREKGTGITGTDLDTLDWYWDQVKLEE